jgi:two-component system response regulator HydG
LREFSQENEKPIKGFGEGTMEVLMKYPWPGNVRELRGVMEGAVVRSRGEQLLPRDLPDYVCAGEAVVLSGPAPVDAPPSTVKAAEKDLITRTLQEVRGNRSEAARRMGMSRRTLHRKLHEYHLEHL